MRFSRNFMDIQEAWGFRIASWWRGVGGQLSREEHDELQKALLAARDDFLKELAASTKNPNYAAKMLGYDRNAFGKMIHVMKEENRLRGDDNVVWHDDGSVEFNADIIDNMHSYAP